MSTQTKSKGVAKLENGAGKMAKRILFVAAECAPLVKTGGLGDVVGALSAALAEHGFDVTVALPQYQAVTETCGHPPVIALLPQGVVRKTTLPSGVPLWLFDCPPLFDRAGIYQDADGLDFPDNAQRFGWFGKMAALLAGNESPLSWRPDIVHCHDWHAGMTPLWLAFSKDPHPPVVTTIHNLAFQGLFPPEMVAALGLPSSCYRAEGAEFYGHLSFLKAALYYSDAITTVSQGYADEISTEAFGFGLDGLLRARRERLVGIMNGIDGEDWDPLRDPHITKPYDAQHLDAKRTNKRALQKEFQLPVQDGPLAAAVSRMTWQKGTDLIVDVAPRWIEAGGQLVILGSGEHGLQDAVSALADQYPAAIAVRIGFDEGLAHRMEAGADLFLMPSRFEPCGLNQMYSQRYGTPPVARATGGLRDSIAPYTGPDSLKTASGLLFEEASSDALWDSLRVALSLYGNTRTWRRLQRNGMGRDFSWSRSVERYTALYEGVSAQRK